MHARVLPACLTESWPPQSCLSPACLPESCPPECCLPDLSAWLPESCPPACLPARPHESCLRPPEFELPA